MILFSPAKLNLFFRVHEKREDGYHEISSLYQAISLGDHITLELSESDSLCCSDPLLPCGPSNLIRKAILLFRQKTGKADFIRCHLEKKIPVGGGLGGGSSNAAATLFGLNELMGRPASLKEIRLWSSELGSDIPFFFSQGTAICTGRGEKIEEVSPSPISNLWVASPDFGVLTAPVYGAWSASANPYHSNDLEEAACAIEPRLKTVRQNLEEMGFEKVSMTGSGSSFFCTGGIKEPSFPGIRFFQVKCISRSKEGWYEKK